MSQESAQQEVLRITISDVLGLLAQGKSRKEIAEYYGRTQSDMNKMVWNHPKLKNRKAKKQYTGIELIDDESPVAEIAPVSIIEANEVFENQEEMGTQAEEDNASIVIETVEEIWR